MNKKHSLVLVTVVIVLGALFFFFRRFQRAQRFSQRQHKLESQLKQATKIDKSQRGPDQGTDQEEVKKMALLPRKDKKVSGPVLSIRGFKLPLERSEARGVFSLGRGKYGLLHQVRAIPVGKEPIRDQFNPEDIHGEYARHLIVNKEALGEDREGKPVVINTHNKRIGIVTGMVSVTFAKDFRDNISLLSGAKEKFSDLGIYRKKDFSHLKLSVWEAQEDFELAALLQLEQWLLEKKEVKKARVEVIESLKVGQ